MAMFKLLIYAIQKIGAIYLYKKETLSLLD